MRLLLRLFLMWLLLGGENVCPAQQPALKEAYYPDGGLRYRGYFAGKQPVGEVTQYYPGGKVKAVLNYKGRETDALIYSKNGEFTSQGKYLDRQKTGSWIYKKGDRLLTEEVYSGGRLEGKALRYYANGKVAEIRTWREGVLSGSWQVFYDNGQLKFETVFVNGKLEGPLKAYDYSGKLTVEGEYKNNRKDGRWRYYTAEGKIRQERYYRDGKTDQQEEDDRQESEQITEMENRARRIADPADFTDEPELYLRITDN